MNYERLDLLGRGYVCNRDSATVWWCNPYEAIWVRELAAELEIWTSGRGEDLDFTWR